MTDTPAGVAALGSYTPMPTGDALRAHYMTPGVLPEGERKVLEVVCGAQMVPVSRETISDVTGFKRSTRDAYVQRLAVRKLVQTYRDGTVSASGELFG